MLARFVAALVAACALACGGSATAPTSSASTSSATNPSCAGTVGVKCVGTNSYVDYTPGNLPIVISVPHGGALAPTTIADRTGSVTTVTDTNTIELAQAIVAAFQSRTGKTPHLIVCELKRTKLDANREVVEAAQGNASAVTAWNEYHAFVEQATRAAIAQSGTGFYIDLHGHGHDIQRLELGYLLTASQLALTDAQLDAGNFVSTSSLIRAMPRTSAKFSEVLRGASSLGGLLGLSSPSVPSVPSPLAAAPGSDPYFDGGYSTDRHTATLPGLQIESNFTGVRDNATSRAAFSGVLVEAIRTFVSRHLGVSL